MILELWPSSLGDLGRKMSIPAYESDDALRTVVINKLDLISIILSRNSIAF
jgi:hypothetical protein